MKIGIIGSGLIGVNLANRWIDAGHSVVISNGRVPEFVPDLSEKTSAPAVSIRDAVTDVDVIVTTIPMNALQLLPDDLFLNVPDDVVVIDTSNYFPYRDNVIPAIDDGMVESVWVSELFGRPIVKTFSAMLAYTQVHDGSPAGDENRLAIPVAGDDERAKKIAAALVDEVGFDPVDAGTLAESWKMHPGTPAYCTNLRADELTAALSRARRDRSPELRSLSLERLYAFGDGFLDALANGEYTLGYTSQDVVKVYRELELEK
ncbi:NADPH-dependent F420 reductase [Nocardia sp. 348MFTsu5.1]|uniref:NADPH-dependent F420 reductase n=1 Tax=Nocardia sp. 348MFTsu5.1 TaxID=1172185 RepID=UPI000360C20C|nr:NAD(P)-binding domain-containing protein [Nocardia sp. 348MFTsu5.1]